ncbi:hypothetical protein DS884_08540 [Tenacibaculum sp. E3R01]|uniref:DUF6370 family protein n=1 Tax=Tenacibaculum sp. E3R01 TaxID=2267227 RepID=UPI000DE8649D|nr:DUF6370 family protein [Tenacibaculum sp. E3R01]RBW59766.1 hypothetical protein DS884_08540 [Tenacibaculum sp. E3R01]
MRYLFILSSMFFFLSCSTKQKKEIIAEASCGQCKFELKSQNGCDLAIKIDDNAYFVEGANIDDFGDAHDEKIGFCNVVRKVKATGILENDKFIASSFEIVK